MKAIFSILLFCAGIAQAQTGEIRYHPILLDTEFNYQPAPHFDTIKVIIQVYKETTNHTIDFGDMRRKKGYAFVGIRGWQVREWKTDPVSDFISYAQPVPYPHPIKLLCCDRKTEPRNVWDFKEINW